MFEIVVLALDGSESSDRALDYAPKLAQEHGSSVRVVHVSEITVGSGGGPVPLSEEALKKEVDDQGKHLSDARLKAWPEKQS